MILSSELDKIKAAHVAVCHAANACANTEPGTQRHRVAVARHVKAIAAWDELMAYLTASLKTTPFNQEAADFYAAASPKEARKRALAKYIRPLSDIYDPAKKPKKPKGVG